MGFLGFSCTSLSFPALNLAGAARVVAALGIPNIDVCLADREGRVEISKVLRDPARAAEQDKVTCAEAGLGIVDVFCVLGRDRSDHPVNALDAAVRSDNRRRVVGVVRYARLLGARGVTLLPGLEWPELADRGFTLACEELSHHVEVARQAGLRLSVEPHQGSIISVPAAAARMAEQVPGLSLTLDYSHFLASGLAQEEGHRLAAHAGHFHARQAALGRLQVGQREGALRFEEIIPNLFGAGYEGAVCLEYVCEPRRGLDNVDVVSETVVLCQQMRGIIAGLGTSHEVG